MPAKRGSCSLAVYAASKGDLTNLRKAFVRRAAYRQDLEV